MKKAIMIINIIILMVLMAVFSISCKNIVPSKESAEESMEEKAEETADEVETVEAEEAPAEETPELSREIVEEADPNAVYNIIFEATWSSDSHPDHFVSSAHFSPFMVYSYNGADMGRIFIEGTAATPGIEDMAETGATDKLEDEIMEIITSNNASKYSKAKSFNSPGQIEVTLEFTQEFSHFIFVSMIAPSPDWFVAAEGNLLIDGQWEERLVLDIISLDAGTDSGDSLTAANSDTEPKQPISLLDGYLQGLGTLTVTRN